MKEAGADINAQSSGGETALIKAINFGKATVVNELLELRADLTVKTHVSYCFLEFAQLSN